MRTTAGVFLIDAGLSARALERVLRQHSVEPSALTAIVVSHEHHDHAQGAGPLARRFQVPIICTPGTARALEPALQGVEVRTLQADGTTIGDVDVWSFALPHDAAEPAGVLLRHQGWTVGIALDFGHIQPHIISALQEADLVVIEANHDRERLLATAYPWSTKHRIMGDYGHLSNLQAAQLIEAIVQDGKRRDVWLGHLSEKANENPQGVIKIVRNYLSMQESPPVKLAIAERGKPSASWHSDLALQQSDLFGIC